MGDERYAVVGLGYVGLPLTLALAETGANVVKGILKPLGE